MSKGPGYWQRGILNTLGTHDAFHLRRLLPYSCTKAAYNALHRAALRLETQGKIRLARFGGRRGFGTIIVHRVGTEFTWDDYRALLNRLREAWWAEHADEVGS